jgi:hypothetical protein
MTHVSPSLTTAFQYRATLPSNPPVPQGFHYLEQVWGNTTLKLPISDTAQVGLVPGIMNGPIVLADRSRKELTIIPQPANRTMADNNRIPRPVSIEKEFELLQINDMNPVGISISSKTMLTPISVPGAAEAKAISYRSLNNKLGVESYNYHVFLRTGSNRDTSINFIVRREVKPGETLERFNNEMTKRFKGYVSLSEGKK